MNKISKSVRDTVWYMGGRWKRRRQTRGMFPIRVLAAPILGALRNALIKNYLEAKDHRDRDDMYRDKVLLRRKVIPQRVTLTDVWSFLAKYERVSRRNLPSHVTVRRNRTIWPGRQRKRKTQLGAGLLGSVFNLGKNLLTSGTLAKGLHLGSKALNSKIGKNLIDEEIKHAP